MTTATSWQHNHECHPPLHAPGDGPGDEPGDPPLHRAPTPAAAWSRHTIFRRHQIRYASAVSVVDSRNLQLLHHSISLTRRMDPLLRRDPTPAAAKPRSRHLSFLRACLHDTPGGALSWRHHLSA